MAVASQLKVSGRRGQQCSSGQKASDLGQQPPWRDFSPESWTCDFETSSINGKREVYTESRYAFATVQSNIQTKRAVDICRKKNLRCCGQKKKKPDDRSNRQTGGPRSNDPDSLKIDKLRLVKLVLPWKDRPDINWKIDFTETNMCINTFWFLWTFSRWIKVFSL